MGRIIYEDKILFRGKNEQGKWVLGDLLHGPKHQLYIMEKGTWIRHKIPDAKTVCRFTGYLLDGKHIWEHDRIFLDSMQECMGTVCFGQYESDFDSPETQYLGFFVQWITLEGGWPDVATLLRKDLEFWLKKEEIQIL